MTLRGIPSHRESGFSLAELLVFMALLGVILTMAFTVAQVVSAGQRTADRETYQARAITYPMSRMSEILIQNTTIEVNPAPTPYSLSVRTDQNLDDIPEQHNFRIITIAGETYIEHVSYNMTAAGVRITPARLRNTYGPGITNLQDGVPLFTYYPSGTEPQAITDMGLVRGQARSVRVTIQARNDDRTITDSVVVVFRNRDR
ncbi:MAG: prepilin-type N-terminal cleavage/methylation domain-containing protein [Actinobacteria bacterium]|nr:prepilin-type N-terminal cleavage/methylation domain-containing protein [Actinomycetota bacterium]MCL5887342.1 prepilin-type N-terminal cleavage/methylation domain-containing protein [Actinomycetota bacterium]